jgi:hypothetical protein
MQELWCQQKQNAELKVCSDDELVLAVNELLSNK